MKTLTILLLVLTVSIPTFADTDTGTTSDYLTPATETVCVGVESKFPTVPGIKGRCNSYCEARDCDLPANYNTNSCTKAREKLIQLSGDVNAVFPCEEPKCPCAEMDLWQEMIACADSTYPCSLPPMNSCYNIPNVATLAIFNQDQGLYYMGMHNINGTCGYVEIIDEDVIDVVIDVDTDEAELCRQDVFNYYLAVNAPCL